jgi:hypothetical protein
MRERGAEDLAAKDAWMKGFRTKYSCCGGCFSFFASSSGQIDDDKGACGYLWKCNHDVIEKLDLAELGDLRNWRRRLFFVRDHHTEGRMLAYISEKENGSLQVESLVARATCKKLPPATVSSVFTDQEKNKLHENLHHYDISALAADPRGSSAEDYASQIPRQLWPIAIHWKDSAGQSYDSVIAATNSSQQDTWFSYIGSGMELPGCMYEDVVRESWNTAVAIKYGGEGR